MNEIAIFWLTKHIQFEWNFLPSALALTQKQHSVYNGLHLMSQHGSWRKMLIEKFQFNGIDGVARIHMYIMSHEPNQKEVHEQSDSDTKSSRIKIHSVHRFFFFCSSFMVMCSSFSSLYLLRYRQSIQSPGNGRSFHKHPTIDSRRHF